MICRVLFVAGTVLLADASGLSAQAPSPFGTCAYWNDQKPDPAKPATVDTRRTYRLGFAAGFVLGVVGDLPAERSSETQWELLQTRYDKGLLEALQRPAFLVDAFDQKCGDYRNRAVRLNDVGLLIMLEVGGVSSQQIERALEIMRAGGDDYKTRAVETLSSSPSR